ncbi:hypothetical protein ACFX2H_013430 [Malus domestica]
MVFDQCCGSGSGFLTNFTVFNQRFSSILGRTQPNRLFVYYATPHGSTSSSPSPPLLAQSLRTSSPRRPRSASSSCSCGSISSRSFGAGTILSSQ